MAFPRTTRAAACSAAMPLTAILLASAASLANAQSDDETAARVEAYRHYALETAGDPAAGARLFVEHEQLACLNCHRITGVEKSGPNLDGIGDKYTRAELIKHILQPNASIKPGYEQAVFLLRQGLTVTGRINRATKEVYRVFDEKGADVTVSRDDIEQMHESPVSLMPTNVALTISRDQFADLIAYLQSLRTSVVTGLRAGGEPVEIPRLDAPVELRPINPPGVLFENPVWCGGIPGQLGHLVVVEHQTAKVWRLFRSNGQWTRELFLDLGDEVKYGHNWGLMCLAFHPQYEANRRYFLEYEVDVDGQVETTVFERRATPDGLRDAGESSRRLLGQEQPAYNHNGGCIAFGPDGMLYIAFGDGGPQRDPPGHSQNPRIVLGSMLRIDVDRRDDRLPYAIPPDNPFVEAHQLDPEIQPETWATGFREPWRFSFDAETGELWMGDVGQDKFEEVSLVRRGENHGWNVLEGFEPFSDQYRRDGERYAPPLFVYPRSLGVSVTGGRVYRGKQSPSFDGVYIFGDYETRRIWGLKQAGGALLEVRELGQAPEHIASFGVDSTGEIYIVGYEGSLFHLELAARRFE